MKARSSARRSLGPELALSSLVHNHTKSVLSDECHEQRSAQRQSLFEKFDLLNPRQVHQSWQANMCELESGHDWTPTQPSLPPEQNVTDHHENIKDLKWVEAYSSVGSCRESETNAQILEETQVGTASTFTDHLSPTVYDSAARGVMRQSLASESTSADSLSPTMKDKAQGAMRQSIAFNDINIDECLERYSLQKPVTDRRKIVLQNSGAKLKAHRQRLSLQYSPETLKSLKPANPRVELRLAPRKKIEAPAARQLLELESLLEVEASQGQGHAHVKSRDSDDSGPKASHTPNRYDFVVQLLSGTGCTSACPHIVAEFLQTCADRTGQEMAVLHDTQSMLKGKLHRSERHNAALTGRARATGERD